jgi:hypothetical protein
VLKPFNNDIPSLQFFLFLAKKINYQMATPPQISGKFLAKIPPFFSKRICQKNPCNIQAGSL